MDSTYEELANYLLSLYEANPEKQHFIGVAGSPGSGKTTTTLKVVDLVNTKAGKEICTIFPMDGFHFYKAQLKEFKNPDEAFARRGAVWTFDAERFAATVRKIKEDGHGAVPSFDHGVGDPVENDIRIEASHRIVLVEGNYLYMDLPGWREASELLDERWFIAADEDEAMERVVKRHIGTGNTEELARHRVASNDRLNAKEINLTSSRATRVVKSQNDEKLAP